MNLQEAMNAARKAQDTIRMAVLGDVINRTHLLEKELKHSLSRQETLEVLNKMAKDRVKSIEMYKEGKRQDLVDKEQAELDIILAYLPKRMTKEEIQAALKDVLEVSPDKSSMGTVIKNFSALYPGQDNKLVVEVVRELFK